MIKHLGLLATVLVALVLPAAAQKLSFTAFAGPSRSYIPMESATFVTEVIGRGGPDYITTHYTEDYSNNFGVKAGLEIQYELNNKFVLLAETSVQTVSFMRMLNREMYRNATPEDKFIIAVNSEMRQLYVSQTLGAGYKIVPRLQLQAALRGSWAAVLEQKGHTIVPLSPGEFMVSQAEGTEGVNVWQLGLQAGLQYKLYEKFSVGVQYQRGFTTLYHDYNHYGGEGRYQGASLVLGYTFLKK